MVRQAVADDGYTARGKIFSGINAERSCKDKHWYTFIILVSLSRTSIIIITLYLNDILQQGWYLLVLALKNKVDISIKTKLEKMRT